MQHSLSRWVSKRNWLNIFAVVTCLATAAPTIVRAEIAIQDGRKLAFLGDSITAGGWSSPGGYVRLVLAGLAANGVQVTPVPAGIGGHKSNQMLERLKRDVLDKQPDWMTLSCGVNDVWHGERGVPLEAYKTNITAIIDQCQAAGVKVMILTATVIGEELDNANNQKLAPYNEFLRALAKEKKCLLADLNARFQEVIKSSPKPGRVLTSDGVHMNSTGDQLMAQSILTALGLDAAQLGKARAAWQDIPNSAAVRASFTVAQGKVLQAKVPLTLGQVEKLRSLAARSNQPLDDWISALYATEVQALLKPAGAFESAAAIFEAGKDKEVQAQLQTKLGQRLAELLPK